MFSLKIKTENAAFEGDERDVEIARILRDVADRVERGDFGRSIFDVNGNKVGYYEL